MIIKYKQIKDINDIKWDENVNYLKFTKPLYHGTTKKAVSATNGEIVKLQECCKDICDRLIPECQKHINQEEFYEFLHSKEVDDLGSELDVIGTEMFEYGSFYLTNDFGRAVSYSKNKEFGEVGRLTKRLIKVKEKFNLLPDDTFLKHAILFFKSEIIEYENSESVVLVFNNVLYEDILLEDGMEIDNEMISDLYDFQESFRLKEPLNKYEAKVIPNSLFNDLLNKLGYVKVKIKI